ncbi:autotransporter-associated beta strand repeat-containing protein [Geminisphaera colitermitum]|uniref:autotransporter-associated beta strand repeat-containing protein n=1 Tax=Geminisphaera colitermitum TaxID=1148786 RepID=UPI000158CBE6|nr:autotransporter-associated beta strand repeat-containing protein [Geminisphaera colitermitum]
MKKTSIPAVLRPALLIPLTCIVAHAENYTREGVNGTNWNDTTQWTPSALPGANDNASINLTATSDFYVNGNFELASLTLTSSATTNKTLNLIALGTNGTYSLAASRVTIGSTNATLVFQNNSGSNQRLDVSIGTLDLGTYGNSVSFGRADGTRVLNNLAINHVILGGDTSRTLNFNINNNYTLGHLDLTGTGTKTINLISRATTSVGITRTATVTGIDDTSNATTIKGSVREATTANAATLRITTASGTAYSASTMFADGIGGTLKLVKDGAGTQTLLGASTHTGSTEIETGLLATGATGDFGLGDVRVGAASLTLGNAASIADTATLFFKTDSTVNLSFTGTELLGALINETNGISATAGTYTAEQLNAFFGVSVFGGNGLLNIAPIPEPSVCAALGGLAALGLAGLLHRRMRNV